MTIVKKAKYTVEHKFMYIIQHAIFEYYSPFMSILT